MPIVRVPDGRQVRFPDDMPREQIKAIITEKFQQPKQEQFTPEQIEDARIKGQEMLKNSGIDTSLNSVANAFADGFSKGYIGGAERVGSGATFGLTDWIGDKLGTGVKERRKELEDESGAITALNVGLDIAGGIPTGGALFKGLSAGAKAIPYAGKALKALVPTATGAISGGLYSGFENDSLESAGKGALVGGVLAGGLDLGLKGLGKAWSATEKIKNTPRGFENAVGTKQGARILNRAVRESDDIAERVYGKAPEALDNLNVRAMDKLDDAVKGGVDVKGRMAGAKKAYGDFIDQNKAKQVIEGKFTPEEYQANLKKWGGNEIVIGKDGKPLVVYHGTPNKGIDKFKYSQKNQTGTDFGEAYYSTSDYRNASGYGYEPSKDKRVLDLERKTTKVFDKIRDKVLKDGFSTEVEDLRKQHSKLRDEMIDLINSGKHTDTGGDVIPLYVKMKKPLTVDAGGKNYNEVYKSYFDKARSSGNDGIIVKNVVDVATGGLKPSDVYISFSPNQYKSVQNSGAFTNTASLTDKGVKPLAKVSDLGITGLTENQKSWLNQAWTSGKRNTLEKAGSLGHLDEMSKELNKMVQGSRLANPNGVGTIATPETVALQGLKDKVDDVIEKAGLQNIKSQYKQAKALEDSFNQGLNFNPNSVKTRNITFKTPDEQSAFAQGLVERVKMNPESKNIAGKTRDLRGALRKALGENADGVFKEMDNINKSYKNVEKVLGNAERKLSVPEPINGKVGLLREFVESPGSVVGGLADFARRWATAKSAERAAKYLLDPTLKLGNSPYEAIRQYTPTIGALGIGNLIRKGE